MLAALGAAAGAFFYVRAKKRKSEGKYNPAEMEATPGKGMSTKKKTEHLILLGALYKVFLVRQNH